jgi:hypothetical protein
MLPRSALSKEAPLSYRPESGYETAVALNLTRRGPLRFEEGVATDTDIPNDFGLGAYGDTQGDNRGRPYTVRKDPVETMRERAHVGSATWIEAPTMLQDFVIGASVGQTPAQFEMELGSERRLIRQSPATVMD